jgi:hypothetical protein
MMLRSVVQLTTMSPGFESRDVYVGRVALAEPRYQDDADRRRFADSVLARLRATAGVRSVVAGWIPARRAAALPLAAALRME